MQMRRHGIDSTQEDPRHDDLKITNLLSGEGPRQRVKPHGMRTMRKRARRVYAGIAGNVKVNVVVPRTVLCAFT